MWMTWMFMLLVVCTSASSGDLRIGAFNIQVFGMTKANKPDVMAILVKIIRRYDLLLIQEIKDITNTAIFTLLDQVNEAESKPFKMVLSERLGRTQSKEQYAFLYKPNSGLAITKQYVYNDVGDIFEREPFIVSFTSNQTVMTHFGLAGIHVDPENATYEIGNLSRVFGDMKMNLSTNDVMVMGDLNADCRYVTQSEWSKIEIKSDPEFIWWIGDDIDTTVKDTTDCAYDRLISHGDGWRPGIVNGSARVYRFDEDPAIGEMNKTMAGSVSDHYPVEFVLQGNNITVFESGELKGELRLETPDELRLNKFFTSIDKSDVMFHVKPIKKRKKDKQKGVLYMEVPSTKPWIVNWREDVCLKQFEILECVCI